MDDNPSFEEQQPIQTAISLHPDYFQITPQPEEPSVEFYGDFEIDSCYVSSKLPLGYIVCWQEDILAGLECFRSQDAFAYNTKEWENILSGMIQEYQGRLSASIYSGLPKRLRLKIWLYLARVNEIRQRKLENEIRYHKLRVQPCADVGLVDKDVVRSFGNISFFQSNGKRNLQSLSNILYAYANFDPDVGYTQGLNFLAGMLLLLMSSEKEENNKSLVQQEGREKRHRKSRDDMNDCEEEAFWMLVYIMQEKDWRMMFLDDTPKLLEMLEELEEEMKERAPKVYECLTKLNCIAACFSQYFLTVYLFSTPYEFAKRVLEIFLIGGYKVLIHITIKVLMLIEEDLFEMNSIEEILPFLKTDLIQFAMSRYPNQFAKFLAEQPV